MLVAYFSCLWLKASVAENDAFEYLSYTARLPPRT